MSKIEKNINLIPFNAKNFSSIIHSLKKGSIGIIPTDTIYGLAASALSEKAVKRSYHALERDPKKPYIILISSVNDLALFEINLDSKTIAIIQKIWPGKISAILPIKSKNFGYLHRGVNSLAFRVPDSAKIIKLLERVGPLISTSANPEGLRPAKNIEEAIKYFGNNIDFYADSGLLRSAPSTLIEINNGKARVIRKGAFPLTKLKKIIKITS